MKQNIIQELINIAQGYDWYTQYIDNYRQEKQAEQANERIIARFTETAAKLDITVTRSDFHRYLGPNTIYSTCSTEECVMQLINKKQEESTMKHSMPNETINKTNNQEVTTMKRQVALIDNATKHVTETTLDTLDMDTIVGLKELTKDVLRAMLEEEHVILTNNAFKKAKRIELIEILYTFMHPEVPTAPVVEEPVNNPLATAAEVKPVAPQVQEPKTYDSATIRSIIATVCMTQWNNKTQKAKNYISAFMLESCINRVLHGIWTKHYDSNKKGYVDNTFTDVQVAATKDMMAHLLTGPYFIPYKDKGFIINAEYLAWFYETQLHAHLVYRFTFADAAKGFVDYRIDKANKTVTNLKTNKVSPIDWNKINTTLNFCRVEENK